MTQITMEAETDLEALFDRVASERARGPEPAKATPATPASPPAAGEATDPVDVFQRIGSITRKLHDALRELGYDQVIDQAVNSLPDTRARLTYIATLTGKAAERTLTAVERGKAAQESVRADASRLAADWERLYGRQVGVEEFRALGRETRAFLDGLPARTEQTEAQLLEIMMAQDFHDLTGQTVQRIAKIVQFLEEQLVKLLIDSTPSERRSQLKDEFLTGPAVDPTRSDVVANQSQVDNLLESLGF
ncbi:MAG: protein phosphatase CheZ [Burkholderiales bacterium]